MCVKNTLIYKMRKWPLVQPIICSYELVNGIQNNVYTSLPEKITTKRVNVGFFTHPEYY